MGSAIIEINNVYGSLLISETHPSLNCREKGVIATNTNFTINNVELPLMAFRCAAPCVVDQLRSGNSITYRFVCSSAETVYWYYHDRPVPLPDVSGQPVAQAFDSLGRCTAELMGKVGRVVGTTFGTYPAGREYAAVCLSNGEYMNGYVNDPTGNVYDRELRRDYYANGVAVNGNTISYGQSGYTGYVTEPYPGSPSYTETYDVPPSVIILDVTGY